ncbi:hypothetical protein B7494_g1476 [Chlorociboria aeruginascens]|nr:hypothetical protein B7494_g1476 [Chlorociboria aeruginascens]
MMALWRAFIAFTFFGILADAIPTIAFPLNSQVPPVARIGEPFSYSFSHSTFSSSFPLTYTLSDAPTWLSLENNTRILSGTPSAEDVDANTIYGFDFGLTASDQSGSTTLNATLVVSKNPAPIIKVPSTTQLESFGVFSAPSTLLYHPSTPFKLQFDAETFSGTSNLTYYAVTSDNTPLPSWVVFDPKTLSFSGQTPDYLSLIQPPQTFGVQLIASDVEGFGGISIKFNIEVGVHVLGFLKSNLIINATSGVEINFDGLAGSLELDGVVANPSSLSSVIAQAPSWLAFNNSSFALSGIPPTDASSYNVTIQASDIYGDVANTTVLVDISAAIFTGSIQGFNATIGTTFSQDLSSFVRNGSDIDMTAEFSPATPWLVFNAKTFVLSGQVPSNIDPTNILITLNATSKTLEITNYESFQVHVLSKSAQTTSLTSKASAATTSETQQSSSSASDSKHGLRKNVIIAILIPIVLTFLAVLFCFLYYLNRRHNAKKSSDDSIKSEISAPLGNTTNVDTFRPTQTIRPIPALELDTSGFSETTDGSATTPQKKAAVRNIPRKSLRRSQTVSVVSGTIASELADAQSAVNRVRANSENALSGSDPSWRSTQDSNYQTSGSRTDSSRLSRNYSNYSRKGHIRRSARLISASDIGALRDSSSSAPLAEGSILNLSDNNFSASPLDNFTVLSHSPTVQVQRALSSEKLRLHRKSATRNLRFAPTVQRRRSGIGHGGRESISSFSGTSIKRRSIGHGQDPASPESSEPAGPGHARDSRTWLTVEATEVAEKRCISNASNMTESTDLLYPPEPSSEPAPLAIREGPGSPVPKSFRNSNSSTNARPVSRRIIGSSPFFGGGSTRNSRRSNPSKHIRTSFADSPTVPEEATMSGLLENRVIHGLRDTSDSSRDPLGISYGLAREGTRQLKSFVQNQLTRTRTRASMKSMDSKDSRFESADTSMYSLPRPDNTFGNQRNVNEKGDAQDEYEDYLPENDSEGSWETHYSRRDSRGNAIESTIEDSAKELKGAGMSFQPKTGMGDENALPDIGPNARMVPGKGKRPVSVLDVKGKDSMRAKVERGENDYTAYI